MVRIPCCEKMGMKKGAWTPEEDQILISYIQKYGHGNWRALPKQAGLPRCGKSCRLRWINYLRPDIKRGNFTSEEEGTIFKLHQALGNRWSAIAAKLPGRTDNEIKNYWHGHLKKKFKQSVAGSYSDRKDIKAEARILLHQHKGQSPGLLQSSISPPPESTATTQQPEEELGLTREQQGAVELPAAMVESLKNNGFYTDGNNRDFWYNLFMENSNEAHGDLGQSEELA